jgi:hypothetical protein
MEKLQKFAAVALRQPEAAYTAFVHGTTTHGTTFVEHAIPNHSSH